MAAARTHATRQQFDGQEGPDNAHAGRRSAVRATCEDESAMSASDRQTVNVLTAMSYVSRHEVRSFRLLAEVPGAWPCHNAQQGNPDRIGFE